ncbi:hypothetical protein GGI20_005145 [Coemansia sp. BCRC 34301]|nr:hypothetical protein GGI20_005145 [Coemansia sp. BCRC 34301]
MRRLRRVISKQSTTTTTVTATTPTQQGSPVTAEGGGAGWSTDQNEERVAANSSDAREGSFLGIERWPMILGRSSQRRRDGAGVGMHRSSQSFSMPYTPSNTPTRDWRILRDGSKHKRTSSSSVLPAKPQPQPQPQRLPFTTTGTFSATGKSTGHQPAALLSPAFFGYSQQSPDSITTTTTGGDLKEPDFIGYPPGGLEIRSSGLVLVCEQKSPDVCEYVVRRDSAGLRASDMLAIALVSWAAHIFFRGPTLLALLPMVVYLVRSSLQVYQESLVVIRNVGIQTETVTLAGFRSVRSFELFQIDDMVIHEALQLFEYRYYMAVLPRDPKHNINIMFPNLLPKLEALLPIYHGSRLLLFSK